MAARRKKSGRKRQGRSAATASRSRWRLAWRVAVLLLLGVGFTAGFQLSRYAIQMDRVVRERFEGRLFRVPSRVLSAPTILYPGLDWKQIDLRGTLGRLGYREASSPRDLALGRFHWKGDRVLLHRRPFDHPSRAEPARVIGLRLGHRVISDLRDAQTGRELGAAFLEPELVGAYYGPNHQQRELVHGGDVPRHLVDAILAVEDQRFLSHRGIDVRRIAGALWANVRAGGITQGGSTLTQQLVKNFFLTPERSYTRKAQEAVMALIVEARYDKQAILEAYMNEIYLGQRGSTAIHGVGEAARLYFGKSARDLTAAESALIAATIQSPNGRSPFRHPEKARERRDLVLRLMKEQDRIDAAEYAASLAEPMRVAERTPEPREARFFLDALQRQLPDFYDGDTLATEGLHIYSTLDMRLQRAAAAAVRDGLAALEKEHPELAPEGGPQLQACLVALRPQTGEVLALVGGRDYGRSQYDRCTLARRPAGSIFKPFVYVAALEPVPGGPLITLVSRLSDDPFEVSLPGGAWKPRNFDREFHGTVSVREALEHSYNVATARLGQQVGIPRVIDAAERLGIESPLPRVPSLAIGAADLAPLEVARAYATLANGGIRPRIRTFEDVVDPRGGAVDRQPIRFERVLDAGTAYLATSLLEGVVDRGTAASLRRGGLAGPIAGKTGTSDEERDAWFVGFTPELVVAVWVGFDEPRSLGLASSRVALPIWLRFAKQATGGKVRGAFLRPGDVEVTEVHPETGALALAGCPQRSPEVFLRGTAPMETCPSWGSPREVQRRRDRSPDGDAREPGLIERLFDRWLDRL